MFPFLSVLCTVIGVMMLLMLLIISSRVVADQQEQAGVPPAPFFAEDDSQNNMLSEEDHNRLKQQIVTLNSTLEEKTGRLSEMRAGLIQLEEMLAVKEDEDLAAGAGSGLIPGAPIDGLDDVVQVPINDGSVLRKPIFIEIDAEGYLVHPDKKRFTMAEIEDEDSPLAKFLNQIDERRKKEYLLFLIHPNGVIAYEKLQLHLLENFPHRNGSGRLSRIGTGKEPFSPNWRLVAEQNE